MIGSTHSSWRLLLLTCLLIAAPARATPPVRALARARLEYRNQEYQRVIRILEPLLSSPAPSRREAIEGFELLGLSQLILGHERQARLAFERLLELDPAHQLQDPSGSPKLRGLFERVRAARHPSPTTSSTVAVPIFQPKELARPARVEQPRSRSIFRRWWFWTAVGVVAAGTAAAIVLGARETLPEGNLAPGVVQLR